jgi:hypothetical protein
LVLGDLPARQFESGNNIGGHYPCPCGISVDESGDIVELLKPGRYLTLQSRYDEASSISPTEQDGSIYVNKMKVLEQLTTKH